MLIALTVSACGITHDPRCEDGCAIDAAAPTATEAACDDGDDDHDGAADCADTDCDARACGAAALCEERVCRPCEGLACAPLPPIEDVRANVHGDTAVIELGPVDGARDYRIYRLPAPGDVTVEPDGRVIVANAIYRCAGLRPISSRAGTEDGSLAFDAETGRGYARSEADAVLGYVFVTPGAGRVAVYRMADPQAAAGFLNADWLAPPFEDANAGEYVIGEDARARLLAAGYRDDGVAFYAPEDGDGAIYAARYAARDGLDARYVFAEGPELEARRDDPDRRTLEERFRVHAASVPGSVPLYRVHYFWGDAHDVLAPGEARFQRALHQREVPLPTVSWPGLTAGTYVVEALDEGCPFPGGHLGPASVPGEVDEAPTITPDEARLDTGELFVNGQHDVTRMPRAIARTFITLAPEPRAPMAWHQTFDPDTPFAPLTVTEGGGGAVVMRSETMGVEVSGCSGISFGPLFGALSVGVSDVGAFCGLSVFPRGPSADIAMLERDRFLHVRMTTDLVSTYRRYPQLMITTVLPREPDAGEVVPDARDFVQHRLGPGVYERRGPDGVLGTADDAPPGQDVTLIVQPFGPEHELVVELCDRIGWRADEHCPRANVYGHHAGDYEETWEAPWLPVPVAGELAGHDRPVRVDVYASTERVYVLLDGEPSGCAALPAGVVPEGRVTPLFRSVSFHTVIDEWAAPEDAPLRYLHEHALTHTVHTWDELGVEPGVMAPPWDETRLPCGARWY